MMKLQPIKCTAKKGYFDQKIICDKTNDYFTEIKKNEEFTF